MNYILIYPKYYRANYNNTLYERYMILQKQFIPLVNPTYSKMNGQNNELTKGNILYYQETILKIKYI